MYLLVYITPFKLYQRKERIEILVNISRMKEESILILQGFQQERAQLSQQYQASIQRTQTVRSAMAGSHIPVSLAFQLSEHYAAVAANDSSDLLDKIRALTNNETAERTRQDDLQTMKMHSQEVLVALETAIICAEIEILELILQLSLMR